MEKPKCKLVGIDSNVFVLAGRVNQALRSAGLEDECHEFNKRLFNSKSYHEALVLMREYVEVH